MTTSYTVATTTAQDPGAGISLQNVAQIGGQGIALAIAGQIFQSLSVKNLSDTLAGRGFSDSEIRGAIAGAQSMLFMQLTGELRDQAIRAITHAMQKTMILVPIAGGIMILAGLGMKRERIVV
ncbi:hypothetical protein NPX13_g2858 [Xylaria arbuscula]|uniref:Uncharacterized protein n=1 Tax=Xylaria arbuscula TaxID=114810 RepID=A0A9W8NJ10_9PEZI|nr:hypothetical protein NPX13_g2858 [Xylaria arbuscula]